MTVLGGVGDEALPNDEALVSCQAMMLAAGAPLGIDIVVDHCWYVEL